MIVTVLRKFRWIFPLLAGTAAAAEPGWQAARWGMNAAELDAAVAGLQKLPGRWEYGGAYAERALPTTIAGVPFLALFQMGASSGRLQQVMLESRRPLPTPEGHRRVAESLAQAYGRPGAVCGAAKPEGEPMLVEWVWRLPDGTAVHGSFIDFTTTGIFSEEAQTRSSLLEPSYQRRRNHWRTLPRRIVVRFHPAERADLMGGCRP